MIDRAACWQALESAVKYGAPLPFGYLLALLRDAEERIAVLEASHGTWPGMPEACRSHDCGYYRHYLAYGGPDLLHEGFHAAEGKCTEAVQAWTHHMDTCADCANPNATCRVSRKMGDRVNEWEQRIRA